MANVLALFIVLQALGLSRALPVCSNTMCEMYCEFGLANDENGCPICQCLDLDPTTTTTTTPTPSPVICFEVTCKCSNYKLDSNGCLDCDCPDNGPNTTTTTTTITPTPPVMCFQVTCKCSNYKLDSNGCLDCDCPDSSPDTTTTTTITPTPFECPYALTCLCAGFKMDSRGCPVCDCPPTTTTTVTPITTTTIIITTTPPDSTCPKFQCFLYCDFGFVRDHNGCETCQCRSDPCNENTCPAKEVCQADSSVLGYVCIPHGHIWCSEEECDLSCESGFEKGENGCYLCKCKEVICQGQVCPPGFECGKVTRGCENEPCVPIIERMCVKVEHCD